MRNYKPFEKTTKQSLTDNRNLKKECGESSPPSPYDDPLDRLARARAELKSVVETEEDTGHIHVTKTGITAGGLPKWAIGWFGIVLALALLVAAIGWAISQAK